MAKTKNTQVVVDRRNTDERRNNGGDRRKQEITVAVDRRMSDRRKTPRRRQIDPTTCERDYSNDEIEFMHALDAYKRASGRMFPTCSEILEVIRNLGYVRVTTTAPAPATPETQPSSTVPVVPVTFETDLTTMPGVGQPS